ncbi:hypothetical protein SAMN04488020_103289 [Palleronia marisminoris]|uniref:Uncharacterized protein n=2 Tax=Palleronia marisminoris TaxID=315423 RepID=A0A1Y5SBZ3_9RHOB|nr:hypothetical protein SAMN04488020_103289 [Palleronia marisminoris]SLN36898.1 hypothetical protein PAM7066_01571 [Palleronia marisminoris]
MMPARFLLAAAFAVAAGGAAAQEAARLDPDWPCVQRKVPTLTPAAIWTGPAIEEAGDWRDDEEVRELVNLLSQRRVPQDEAEATIESFAEGLPAEERSARLTLLFAGLFDTMNAERSEIIEGIERYARHQKALVETIREQKETVEVSPVGTGSEAEQQLFWNLRIFEERRQSLPYICEVPRLVEQRLFALGRAIGTVVSE